MKFPKKDKKRALVSEKIFTPNRRNRAGSLANKGSGARKKFLKKVFAYFLRLLKVLENQTLKLLKTVSLPMRKISPIETDARVATRKELAEILRVNPSTVSRLVREGLPCFSTGTVKTISRGWRPRFYVADVFAWLRENRNCEV